MSASCEIRLHKAFYSIARAVLEARDGKPPGMEEYAVEFQVFQYGAVKAMFEAFAANPKIVEAGSKDPV